MYNSVTLLGYVGVDISTAELSDRKRVSRFTLATTEVFVKGVEKETKTEWHNIVAWNALSDYIDNYVKKGSKVFLQGRLATRNYEKDGHRFYVTEIIVETIRLLDDRSKGN